MKSCFYGAAAQTICQNMITPTLIMKKSFKVIYQTISSTFSNVRISSGSENVVLSLSISFSHSFLLSLPTFSHNICTFYFLHFQSRLVTSVLMHLRGIIDYFLYCIIAPRLPNINTDFKDKWLEKITHGKEHSSMYAPQCIHHRQQT